MSASTCLGRWSHLPEQTVVTESDGVVDDSSLPSPPALVPVHELFDWSEFSGSPAEKARLESLLTEFSDVVATSDTDVGHTSSVTHVIDVEGARPIKQPPRRLLIHKREEVQKNLDKMLSADVAEARYHVNFSFHFHLTAVLFSSHTCSILFLTPVLFFFFTCKTRFIMLKSFPFSLLFLFPCSLLHSQRYFTAY